MAATTMMERLEAAVDFLVMHLKLRAPKRSGNLAINGINKVYDPSTGYPVIVIGGEPAPYAIYTNEPWIDERWHGAANPNQYWIQMAIEEVKEVLIAMLQGGITIEDIQTMTSNTGDQFNAQLDKMAAAYQPRAEA